MQRILADLTGLVGAEHAAIAQQRRRADRARLPGRARALRPHLSLHAPDVLRRHDRAARRPPSRPAVHRTGGDADRSAAGHRSQRAGHHRTEHRRQDRRAQDARPVRADGAERHARARRRGRAAAVLRRRVRRRRRRAEHRAQPVHLLGAHRQPVRDRRRRRRMRRWCCSTSRASVRIPRKARRWRSGCCSSSPRAAPVWRSPRTTRRSSSSRSRARDCAVAAVDFDVDTLTPRYRLIYDSIGRSLALPIARQLGLPAPILAAAEAAQPEQARILGAALERLERTRAQLEAQLDEAQRAHGGAGRARRRIAAPARRAARAAAHVRGPPSCARRAPSCARSRTKGARVWRSCAPPPTAPPSTRFTREQEAAIAAQRGAGPRRRRAAGRRRAAPGRACASATPSRSASAVSAASCSPSTVARAWIQRGSMRFEVPAAQLRPLGRAPAAGSVRDDCLRRARRRQPARAEPHRPARARSRAAAWSAFSTAPYSPVVESVRIVHGVGSGALRRAIHDYLATSPYCAGFRGGESGEGGAGVTVATLHG